jgi:osmotically-inducible protein OsmY
LKQFKTSLPNHQLVVEVDNGNVTVSGMAATPEQLQRIQPVLGTIKGVGMVDITATAPAKM